VFIARKIVGAEYLGWFESLSGYWCPNEVAAIKYIRFGTVLARMGECHASLVAKNVAKS
jgi:hypothetical protein